MIEPAAANDAIGVRRRALVVSLALFAGTLTVYLAFLTVHWSYDAVASGVLLYQWILSGKLEQLFHRYHVLYLPFAAAVEWLLRRTGIELDPLALLQMINAPFAAATVALHERLGRALGLAASLSIPLALLLGAGFAYWYYATNGEPYPISTFFLLLGFLAAVRGRPCFAGACLGIAAGFHGTCLLALPPLLVLAWPSGGGIRRGSTRAAAALATAALVLAVPYAVRYTLLQKTDPVSGMGADAAAFAGEEGWSLRPRLADEWRGLANAIAPVDWPALPPAHPRLTRAVGLALLALTLVPLGLLWKLDRAPRRSAAALGLWVGVTFLFFSTYYAGSPKFAVYVWIPLLLLVGLTLKELAPRSPLREVAIGALVALWGTTLFLNSDLARRQTRVDSNPHLVRALAIARLTEPEDLIVHLGRGEDEYQKVYTPYFAARRSLALDPFFRRGTTGAALAALAGRLEAEAAGRGRVLAIEDAVLAGPNSREFETAHRLVEGALARFFEARRPRRLAGDPAVGGIWVLTSPAGVPSEAGSAP